MYDEAIYWSRRYARGGDSGAGSGGEEASWKVARIIETVRRLGVRSILDLGCGDGRVASAVLGELVEHVTYHGLDIAPEAVELCRARGLDADVGDVCTDQVGSADLVLCLDVLFHLASDERHEAALGAVARASRKAALVACWNEGIVTEYEGRFAEHTFFREFAAPPPGMTIEWATVLPMTPSKTLYLLVPEVG